MLYFPDDSSIEREDYKVLIRKELNIPALHMIGHRKFKEVGDKLDDHFHKYMEIVVVLKGIQRYVVEGESYVLHANDIFVTYPYECHGNGELLQTIGEIIWFQIDVSDTQKFLGLSYPYNEFLFRQLSNEHWRIKRADKEDISLLLHAFQMFETKKEANQILGYSYFLQFIVKNFCSLDTKQEEENYSPDIQKALQYIRRNLMEEIKVEGIADYCGLSLSRFKTKFKEQTGITPHAYIMTLRIESSKNYLRNKELSIVEIAYLFRFSSSNHFSTVFKKYVGCTPTEYREEKLFNKEEDEL